MSRKRILIIHNPTSGRRSADVMAEVTTQLVAHGARVDIRVTERPGHATQLAADVAEDSQDCIVAAGGDGTVNEVINGLVRLPQSPQSPPLGIIPLGTANVLACELGLPRNPAALAAVLLDGKPQALYPGILESPDQPARLFAQMAGVGMDARIVAGVDGRLKRLLGKGAYGIEAARQWFKGGLPDYRIDIDGVSYEAASIIIANGRFYGGRFMVAPDARIDAPGFEVLLLKGSRAEMIGNSAAMITNCLSRKAGVRVIKGQKITISGPAGEPVQADGDLMGRLPVSVEAAVQPLMVIAGG